jgi:hypothetical protein
MAALRPFPNRDRFLPGRAEKCPASANETKEAADKQTRLISQDRLA